MYVRIKSWDTMREEYGIMEDGSIELECMFTKDMEYDLPEDRIIKLETINNIHKWNGWSISEDMIEEVLSENYINYIKKHNLKDEI
jgi:hypothetical protein